MTQQEFVLADWIGRLRDSLQALVTYEQETEWALSDLLWRGEQTLGLSGSTHENSTMNIRERVDRYAFVVRDQSRNDSPYQQKVSTLLNQIEQVMLEHPVISQAVYSSKDRSVVDIDLATMRIPGQPVDRMVQGLVDYAFEHSAEAAAEAYAQMIQCGERRELIVDSLMLFRGLHVGERLDITPDMSVISWHEVQRYLSRWSVQSLLDPITGKPREPIGAVVSSVNTGPIILRESRRPEEGWPDRQPSFREQSLMIIDLLAVTHTSTVHTTGRTTSDVDQQFARLTGVSPTFRRSVTGERDNVSELTAPSEPEVSSEQFPIVVRLFPAIRDDEGKLRLALSRLASALSREGPLGVSDKTIDVAIALEVMYQAGSELRYKLATRASYFLEDNAGDRQATYDTISALYDLRSSTVHGRRRLRQDEEGVVKGGFDIARRTLSKLALEGGPSTDKNWDKLVIEGGG